MLARKILTNTRRQMSTYVQYMSKNLQNTCSHTSFDVVRKPTVGEFVMLEQPIFKIQTPDEQMTILSEYDGIVTKVYDFDKKQHIGLINILNDIFGRIPLCEISDDSFGLEAVCLMFDKKLKKPVGKIAYT